MALLISQQSFQEILEIVVRWRLYDCDVFQLIQKMAPLAARISLS
jgi:hypothetical protein